MNRYLLLLPLIVIFLALPGCSGHMEINDTLAPTGMGLDYQKGEKIFSMQMASPEAGTQETTPLVFSDSCSGGWTTLARRSSFSLPKTPLWGMTSSIFISENLAKENTRLFSDFLAHNRYIHLNVLLFLTKGVTPEEVFATEVPTEDYSVTAIEKTISSQEKLLGTYMPVIAKDFLYKLVTPGIEPVLPQIILDKQKKPKLKGTAVFLHDKMVGSLNEYESRGLRYLDQKKVAGGLIPIFMPGAKANDPENSITIELLRSQTKIKPVLENGEISVQISVKAEGNIYGSTGQDFNNLELLDNTEKEAARTISRYINTCITKAQLLESDIFGWGLEIKRKNPDFWEQVEPDWAQTFSRINSTVKVDFQMRRSYLLESPLEYK